MIFVTLGTQDKLFTRLLKDIEREIKKGNIKEEVVVQAGFTKYKSDVMKIFDLLDKDEFDKYIEACDLMITHGGVGSILTGLKQQKKIIACPRLAKYNEHINDHQKEIVEKFASAHYILSYNENDNLGEIIKKAKKFKPDKYKSNTENMIKLIKEYIDNH